MFGVFLSLIWCLVFNSEHLAVLVTTMSIILPLYSNPTRATKMQSKKGDARGCGACLITFEGDLIAF